MMGEGEESWVRDFLSLGNTGSRSGGEREATGGESADRSVTLLSSLSRNGLSLLAGGAIGGISLKPPNPALHNLVERKVSGGAFTGFYRAAVPKTPMPAVMGLRFVSEDARGKEDAAASSSLSSSQRASSGNARTLDQPLRTDVEALSPDECWRLILKLGKRWPAWNGPTVVQSPQGVLNENSSPLEGLDGGREDGRPGNLQVGQDSLKLLASLALEALASTPDRYGRPSRSMLAPERTTQGFLKTKLARDPLTRTSKSAYPALPVYHRQLALSLQEISAPQCTCSAEPRTAPLTIFYAGAVNVSDNVSEDKAHLIMLFAEKAGIKPTPAPSALCAAPSESPAPQATPGSVLSPQETVRPHEDLLLSLPSPHPVLEAETSSSVPSHLPHSATHLDDPSPLQRPAESSTPAEMALAEPPSMPLMVTITEGNSRQPRQQQGPAKPLQNARKSSLARFLDSKKRCKTSETTGATPLIEVFPTD